MSRSPDPDGRVNDNDVSPEVMTRTPWLEWTGIATAAPSDQLTSRTVNRSTRMVLDALEVPHTAAGANALAAVVSKVAMVRNAKVFGISWVVDAAVSEVPIHQCPCPWIVPAVPVSRTRPTHSACHGHEVAPVVVVIAVGNARSVAGVAAPYRNPIPSVGVPVLENSPSAVSQISDSASNTFAGTTGAGNVVDTRICWNVVKVLNAGPCLMCSGLSGCTSFMLVKAGYPSAVVLGPLAVRPLGTLASSLAAFLSGT